MQKSNGGLISRSGSDKSSSINTIVDEKVAALWETETTLHSSEVIERQGLLFYAWQEI